MKKILLLDTGKEWGGGTNSMIELLKRIDRSRYAVTPVFYHNYKRGPSDLRSELARLGYDCLILPQRRQPLYAKLAKEVARGFLAGNPPLRRQAVFAIDRKWRIAPAARRLTKLLSESRYDLLYMNNQPSSNLEGFLAAEAARVPVIQHSRIDSKVNRFEVEVANRNARRIICVSQDVADSLVAQGIRRDLCVVVHNGIDVHQAIPDGSDVRARLGIGSDALVVGTVGSLIQRKRVDSLLDAFCTLRLQVPHAKLLIVGDGPLRSQLESRAFQLGIASDTIFTGFIEQPLPLIAAMDIFVLASESEGLPRVILESMLLSKPVIGSNVSGTREAVRDGETGLLFPCGAVQALEHCLLRLARDRNGRIAMGQAGRARVCREYGIDRYVAGVQSVWHEVAAS